MTVASLLGILTFLIGVPCVLALLYSKPNLRRPLLAIMAFATCYIKKPLYMEIFFVPYRGVDRGFGVTIPDLILFGFSYGLFLEARKTQSFGGRTTPLSGYSFYQCQ